MYICRFEQKWIIVMHLSLFSNEQQSGCMYIIRPIVCNLLDLYNFTWISLVTMIWPVNKAAQFPLSGYAVLYQPLPLRSSATVKIDRQGFRCEHVILQPTSPKPRIPAARRRQSPSRSPQIAARKWRPPPSSLPPRSAFYPALPPACPASRR
jgi:hypothetical protein